MAEEPEVTVGLFGLGLLGSAIADRLSASGISWMGYDPARPDLAATPEAVLAKARTLILCLPDSGHSVQLLEGVRGPRTVIDMTTGDPEEMAALSRRLRERGVRYMDVTIGGSSAQLRDGEAILMAGGEEADLAASLPLLELLSGRVFPCGPAGAGARMKLVFNLVLGLNRAALAEGLAFAERMGLAAGAVLDVLEAGPAASRIMARKGPKMVARDYEPEARLAQHHKDVRLMLVAAASAGLRLPLTEAHERVLAAAEASGHGGSDNSALIEVYRSDSVERP